MVLAAGSGHRDVLGLLLHKEVEAGMQMKDGVSQAGFLDDMSSGS